MRNPQKNRSLRGGFTLLEITIFTAIMLTGLLAMTSTSLTVRKLGRQNDEKSTARSALQAVVEEVRGASNSMNGAAQGWSQVFTNTYSPGGIVGDEFGVAGLEQEDGTPAVCTLTVITDERTTDEEAGFPLGLPRDLDNDGLAISADVTQTAQILPVVATITWGGVAGEQSISQGFYVMSY